MSKTKTEVQNVDEKVKEFSDLLEKITTSEDKKKMLWKEIYENAIVDRMNAYMLFTNVYANMKGGTNEHLQLGPILSKYLERMAKANDQLLKLSEQIAKEQESQAKINPEDIWNSIEGNS